MRGGFSSRMGFIIAAAGSSVGLGNVWKFPFEVANGGGGVFVFIYIIFCFLLLFVCLCVCGAIFCKLGVFLLWVSGRHFELTAIGLRRAGGLA
ncbi:MAG: hypothetical protein ACQPRJ_02530 [Solitalea-like symbiont of Acarus siro]